MHDIYSQLSPCEHPAIMETSIIWTAAKSQAKLNYRLKFTPAITDSS